MEGASANDYDYANGDSVNQFDPTGFGPCPPFLHRTRSNGSHYCKGNAAASARRVVAKGVKCARHVVKAFIIPPPGAGATLAGWARPWVALVPESSTPPIPQQS